MARRSLAFLLVVVIAAACSGAASTASPAAPASGSAPAGASASPGGSNAAPPGGETLLQRVKRSGALQAGIFNFAPAIYTDPAKGEYIGYDIDFLKGFADYLGVQLYLTLMPTAAFAPALQTGRIDIFPDLYNTPERAKILDFSDTYMYFSTVVYANSEKPTITDSSIAQLTGKKVAVVRGAAEADYATKIPNVQLVQLENAEQTFLELSAGRVDAAIQPDVFGDYGIKRNPAWKVKAAGPIPATLITGGTVSQPAVLAVAKGPNTEFLSELSKFIAQYRDGGQQAKDLAKYGMGDSYIHGYK